MDGKQRPGIASALYHERTVIRMADGVSRVYSKPAPWQRIVGKAKQAAVVSALVEKANKKP